MSAESYKNLVIGSGEGGKFLAWHLAGLGQRTGVVERRWIGGSCPNTNCLPSKNEIWSAKVADLVRRSEEFGIIGGPTSVDMTAVRRRKREMVAGLIEMHLNRYQATGAELIMGEAKFTGPRTVDVWLNEGGTQTLTADRVFLNLGTRASIPDVPGLAETEPLTNIEALELDHLPGHLIVIGGGYVGLEFAQAQRRFGTRVTILQQDSQLLANEDPDVAEEIAKILGSDGIEIVEPAEIVSASGRSGSGVTLVVRTASGEQSIEGSDILIAAGRTPNTRGIGLESAGIQLDERGYIKVNDRLETSAPNVWALGECAGSPQFTHASFDDFRIVRDNLAGGNRTTRGRLVPSCLFTDPQVAHVGMTEMEARRAGIEVQVVKLAMPAVLRTRTISETRGFMKALIGTSDDRIVGFTMVGPEAGEVMAVVQVAMLGGLPYTVLREAILAHPTMAEGLTAFFFDVKPKHRKAAG